jgi:EAL domain-containing protein (putative c-di-GMP-specific phosphodiesterase class I)/CHASE2 domain-containing sensor protein
MSNSRMKGLLGLACAALLGLAALVSNIDLGLEQRLSGTRAALRHHAASGEIVLVEIDAASLARLHRWPWPRELYARALDRLTAAGVRSVGFDVDFSAPSEPAQDAAFAAALRRAGGSVYLPTFRQQSGFGGGGWIDSLPIPALRDASFLAAVNVFPDANGIVTSYPLSVVTRDQPRPSIAAMLAEAQGRAGQSFRIDYAIDPSTLPRISFADLVEGKVDPQRLRGKRVLIGATAIELGDRYAAPNYGVIPGAVIQALAAETLVQHGTPVRVGAIVPLLSVLLILALVFRRSRRTRATAAGVLTIIMLAGPIMAEDKGVTVDILPGCLALAAALLCELASAIGEELSRRRFVDRDSGLPNRAALEAAAERASNTVLTVAWLSNFHELATALGRADSAGLIASAAARASHIVGTQVYRVDEGAIGWLSQPLGAGEDEDGHFASMSNLLRYAATVSGVAVDLRPTFGVVTIAQMGVGEAVSGGLIAAQRARSDGTRWARFIADESEEQRSRLALLGELTDALSSGAIWVAYQPKYSLSERRIVGAEALVRWRHPERGPIGPDSFIPLFEEEGRAFELTRFVVDRALSDLRTWREDGADVSIAINLSATLLEEPEMVPMVTAALERSGVPATAVTIELTETAIMANSSASTQRLHDLRTLGLRLSIDDYGTGQSTLSYLRKVPANELKIDKSFIQSITTSANDRLLVSSTLELAHALDLKVVAEGVEDEETAGLLRTLGCDIIQGWHTGRPVPADEFAAQLNNQPVRLAA